ncbi:5'/3'-nucleotidase SurE [Hasllibacter sp. MH4015]|uniref:5'/3'-nucleotidase SurE n=1 Tax=Hasllibacter sp. MH4015 TaxID=2854029 RepID=UPI001CD7AFE7|nr:5'/3'-nucleotidase SurE [Hasllibacter sp. MH4015]
MRILITNDDGINAPGLRVLHAIAADLAGDENVWIVAPAFEQSGVAHCISYTHPTMISEFGPRRFAAEGSPADCVLAGLHDVLKDNPPDLILSGVNKGNNSAENTLYSGTIGAAIEGALQGYKAIALSQYYGPGNISLDDPFEAAAAHGADVVRKILAAPGAFARHPYKTFYNVNFPPVPAAGVKGTRAVAQGFRENNTGFGLRADIAPNGRKFLWVTGAPQNVSSGADTDATVNLDGYISVTPMHADLTAHEELAALKAAVE